MIWKTFFKFRLKNVFRYVYWTDCELGARPAQRHTFWILVKRLETVETLLEANDLLLAEVLMRTEKAFQRFSCRVIEVGDD